MSNSNSTSTQTNVHQSEAQGLHPAGSIPETVLETQSQIRRPEHHQRLDKKGLHSETFTTLLTFCAWFSILGLTFSVVKAEVPSAPINSDVVAAAKTISCSSNGYVRQMIKSSTFTGRGA